MRRQGQLGVECHSENSCDVNMPVLRVKGNIILRVTCNLASLFQVLLVVIVCP